VTRHSRKPQPLNVIASPGTPDPRLGIQSVKDTANSDQAHRCRKPCLDSTIEPENPMLNTEEAAAFLGLKGPTLRDWKCQRIGPPFVQLSARVVRYRRSDLEKFIAARRVVPVVRSIGRFARAAV
jgi:predicted DNA-binding transcriptional regulator AlpA